MAEGNFDPSLKYVFIEEGDYDNHPADPGGATKYGITHFDLARWRGRPDCSPAEVRAMDRSEAAAIYRAFYWDRQHCDRLPLGVDYCVFDYGVNSGVGRSAKVLQRVVGADPDGIIGKKTLAAVAEQDPQAIVLAMCEERLGFLKRLRTWPIFGRGWGPRVQHVEDRALAMIRQARSAA